MKLVLHPPVEPERLQKIVEAARPMTVVNARNEAEARRELADADAFFGKLTPALLGAARRLRWVQAPTASLEHYMFPELVAHPCVLTNMRGLYSDVIADHVFGYILCFARNFHHYIRNQLEARWAPVGGKAEGASRASLTGPATVSSVDRPHPPPRGRHPRRRRPGPDRLRDRAAGARVRDAGPGGRPGPDGRAAGRRRALAAGAAARSPRRERLRRDRRPAHAGDGEAVPARPVPADEAERLPDQHRPRRDRRPRRPCGGAQGGRAGRRGPRRVRDRAPAARPSPLGDAERHPDAARRRQLAPDRRAPPRRPPRQRRAASPAASR